MKNPKVTLKTKRNENHSYISKILLHAIRSLTSQINEKMKDRRISVTFKKVSPYQDIFWNSINSNASFYLFNNSKTFKEFLHKWLKSRSFKKAPKLRFILNHRHSCIDHGRNLSLLIAVTSSASHMESRRAIRDTWGGYAKQRGAQVLFFLGIPKNTKYHSRISEENAKFKDIIQATFLDVYSNLTLKSISVLKWSFEFCSYVKFVLKVDDDMFINIENILNITKKENVSRAILGELAHEWTPVRSIKNKWYTSYQDYPFNIYPDFVFGPSYLLTGDSIKSLYQSSMQMNLFHLEDVYITGFVAEKEHIKRINLPAMFNIPKDLQPCNFKKLLSSHGHTPPDMRRHWMWLSRKNFQCL